MKAELYGDLAGILAIYDSKHPKGKQPAFKKAGRQLSVVAVLFNNQDPTIIRQV